MVSAREVDNVVIEVRCLKAQILEDEAPRVAMVVHIHQELIIGFDSTSTSPVTPERPA